MYLAGNPLALIFKYREIIKQSFIDLRFLDGSPAFTEAEENLKKKLRKKFAKQTSQMPGAVFTFIKDEDRVKIREYLTFEIQIRALKNVTGIYISSDSVSNMEGINLDDLPAERKCTHYWLSYED